MTEFVAPVFTEFIWLLAGGLSGALCAIYLGFQTGQGRSTAPAAWGLPAGTILLSTILAGAAGLFNADLWTGTMAALLIHWAACLVMLPFSGSWLLVLALMAVRESPRNTQAAGAVLVLVLATAGATVVEGGIGGNPVFGYVRGGLFLGAGVLTAATALGTGDPDRRGRAAQLGALVFPVLVATVESAERALVGTMAMRHSADLTTAAQRSEGLGRMLALVDPERPYGAVAVALACLVPVVVFGIQQRAAPDRRALVALWVLILAPLALWVGLPDAATMLAAIEAKAR